MAGIATCMPLTFTSEQDFASDDISGIIGRQANKNRIGL